MKMIDELRAFTFFKYCQISSELNICKYFAAWLETFIQIYHKFT